MVSGGFEHGGRIAIGSDSNIRVALAEELRTLEYSQRLRDRSRAALASPGQSTGRRLFEAAATGGAVAAGRPTGAIGVGKLADLLALDGGHLDLEGAQWRHDPRRLCLRGRRSHGARGLVGGPASCPGRAAHFA